MIMLVLWAIAEGIFACPKDSLEADYKKAVQIQNADLDQAIGTCESILKEFPSDPRSDKVYFLLGQLMMRSENRCNTDPPLSSDQYNQCQDKWANSAWKDEEEFVQDEISGRYLYLGTHFIKLLELFPNSDLADDAAYAITNLSQGGECEGYVDCYIMGDYRPVADFLRKFPTSPYAEEAVFRANKAFTEALENSGLISSEGVVGDLTKDQPNYFSAEVRTILDDYESLAATLPKLLQSRAMETISRLEAGFRNK